MNKRIIPDARAMWRPEARASNNGDFISIEAYSGYSLVMADPTAEELLLEPNASDEELGTAILHALKQSRWLSVEEDIEIYEKASENYAKWVQKLMNLYGYKTKGALFKKMRGCDINMRDGIITIEPTYHEKPEAWSGEGIKEEDYVKVPANSPPADIGAALRLAFSRCTGLGTFDVKKLIGPQI